MVILCHPKAPCISIMIRELSFSAQLLDRIRCSLRTSGHILQNEIGCCILGRVGMGRAEGPGIVAIISESEHRHQVGQIIDGIFRVREVERGTEVERSDS